MSDLESSGRQASLKESFIELGWRMLNAKAFGDTTPIHVAVREGSKKIARLLLLAGANIYAKGGAGLSTFELNMNLSTELAKLLNKTNKKAF